MVVVSVLLALVVVPVLYLMWARFYAVLSPESIQGSDLHMFKWCEEEDTRAWAGFHLTLDGGMPYDEVKATVAANIARDRVAHVDLPARL